MTNQDNAIHAVQTGLRPVGENHCNARLTDDQVRDIRQRISNGQRNIDIANHYGITYHIVSKIKRKLSYVNVV